MKLYQVVKSSFEDYFRNGYYKAGRILGYATTLDIAKAIGDSYSNTGWGWETSEHSLLEQPDGIGDDIYTTSIFEIDSEKVDIGNVPITTSIDDVLTKEQLSQRRVWERHEERLEQFLNRNTTRTPMTRDELLQYRQTDMPIEYRDLSNLDLSGIHLANLQFVECDFIHVQLRYATLDNCSFQDCDFTGSDLTHLTAYKCSFKQGARGTLAHTQMPYANFIDCNFHKMVFNHSQMSHVQLVDTDLNQLRFEGCNLQHANFSRSQGHGSAGVLPYTSFAGSDLAYASFRDGYYFCADFSGTERQLADFTNCTLKLCFGIHKWGEMSV